MPDHHGFATLCPGCNVGTVEPERLGAHVTWEGKHTPVIDIMPLSKARKHNAKGNRLGASVLRTMAQSQLNPGEFEPLGANSGASPGSAYNSKMNEKFSTKR